MSLTKKQADAVRNLRCEMHFMKHKLALVAWAIRLAAVAEDKDLDEPLSVDAFHGLSALAEECEFTLTQFMDAAYGSADNDQPAVN